MQYQPLEIRVRQNADSRHLVFEGEMDHLTVTSIKPELDAILEGLGEHVVADLCGVNYLDSAGLYFLLATRRQLEGAGRALQIVIATDGQPYRALRAAQLHKILDVVTADSPKAQSSIPGAVELGVLSVPRSAGHNTLVEIRTALGASCRKLQLRSECIEELQMAVTEAVTNALLYGCPNADDAVGVRWQTKDGCLVIDVQDHGPGFTPPERPQMPDAEALHGRGIPLMSLASDELRFHVSPSGTRVEMKKRLP